MTEGCGAEGCWVAGCCAAGCCAAECGDSEAKVVRSVSGTAFEAVVADEDSDSSRPEVRSRVSRRLFITESRVFPTAKV